ncbi:MAG TPA: M20/M25/M40 family metallo-hydrolase, partial [Bacteroidota bacterium]|nr:M20/M25/M40 family metallo-hydrolase [Bacteroidota bacterium]
DTYKGKLKGKIVLLDTVRAVKAHFTPEGTRDADSTLLELADAGMPNQNRRGGGGGNPFRNNPAARTRALLTYRKWQLCQDEGAVAVLNVSPRGDGGNVFVQQATVPMHPDTPFTKRINAYDPKAPEILPQIMVAAEHYDRLIRMMQRGEHPKITMDLDVKWYDPDSSYDVIAEYPGTDPTLKDEVVMIGAHFDSWHGGTGATDNGTGSAVCMEAMRILKTIGAQPKRTIRIGLWSGEEEGLLGSAAYVKAHLGERDGTFMNDPTSVKQLPEADKFDVYFNNDNGSGKVRGVYMQGNDQVRNIFHAWLEPFRDMGAYTLSLNNTGGTDHLSFDAVGLPGFQFIQDPLEYDTRTHHSTMDLWERAQEGDLEQAATIMAAFAYDAAVRDQKFPRKELPGSKTTQGGSSQGTGTGKN